MSEARPRADCAAVAAVAAAAGSIVFAARVLRIDFRFRPNGLGIVSWTTLHEYPVQQETFWLVFAVGAGSALAWLLARALRRADGDPRRGIGVEVLGAAVLGAALWLPAVAAWPAAALLLGGAALLAWRVAGGPSGSPQAGALRELPARPRRRSRQLAWLVGCLLVASFYAAPHPARTFWNGVANVAHDAGDRQLARDGWYFMAEQGQYLFWADSVWKGGSQGRDFFCLYGPLQILGIDATWRLFGRSIAALTLYDGSLFLAGMASLALLVLALARHRAVVLAIPFLVPYVSCRIGLGLLGLACLAQWLARDDRRWCAAAGVASAVALLFSQEYGLALLVASAVALWFRRDRRAALAFAAGLVATVLPFAGWLATRGALLPMLADMIRYPSYVLAGYGNLPFPALIPQLPLSLPPGSEDLTLRVGYAIPLFATGAILLSLPLAELDIRHPLVSARDVRARLAADPPRLAVVLTGVFGLLCFRAALGRSDLVHMSHILPPAAALLCVALDRCIALWRRAPALRRLAAWRGAALACLVATAGLPLNAQPWQNPERSGRGLMRLLTGQPAQTADARVLWLTDWVRTHSSPEDPVLFLPNHAAYSYLTERTNPTRFALSHQIVTDAHRAEVLADLEAHPPSLVVIDRRGLRVDGIPYRRVLGEDVLRWLAESYAPVLQEQGFGILGRNPPQGPAGGERLDGRPHATRRAPATYQSAGGEWTGGESNPGLRG